MTFLPGTAGKKCCHGKNWCRVSLFSSISELLSVKFRFNHYVVDSDAFQLSADGIPVEIDPLAFDLLVYLIKHHQEVVTRDDLLNQLWKGKVVSESALSARIRDVRKAVGDSGKTQSVIRTVHGRGYQFVAELTTDTESSDVESSARELLEPELIPPRDTPSIAVLPFTDLAADTGQSYFAEGMTDEITTALSKIRNLMVIARLSTSGYTGSEIDPVQVGKEQGVGYVLMGTVNRQNDRIRVNVRLIDGHSGAYVWSESYDRDMTGLFDVQDEISREIAVALDVRLVGGEKVRKLSAGTRNIKAWKALRQGQYLAVDDVKPEVKKRGRELVEEALDHDPNYATAWVMLGWIYQQYSDVASLATDSAKNSNPTEQMLACAERALNADPECAEAYSLLAMYHLEVRSYDQALEAAEKSVAMAPNNAEVLSEASMVFN